METTHNFFIILLMTLVGLDVSSCQNPSDCQINYEQTSPYAACSSCQLQFSYDFIIIGGGTTGCIVASRLSEEQQFSVLLVEAGGDETYLTRVPFLANQFIRSPFVYNYTTTKQTTICQSTGGICDVSQARCLGGTSSINKMVRLRGLRETYDKWAADGNAGWAYDDILKYFYKTEGYIPSPGNQNSWSLGVDGPQKITEVNPIWERAYATAALKETGLNQTDLNAPNAREGFMPVAADVYQGARMSSNRAYIQPILARCNLDIILSSTVTRILVDNGTAVGVELVNGGKTYWVTARKEVILSAGAINSAKILMLSGIGPADQLLQLGITPVTNSPVGMHLLDHPGVSLPIKLNNVIVTTFEERLKVFSTYVINGSTEFTYYSLPAGFIVAGFVRSSLSSTPDMSMATVVRNQSNLIFAGIVGSSTSIGTVTLNSKSPSDMPLINPNFLGTNYDRQVMRELVLYLLGLINTNAMKILGAEYDVSSNPLCSGCKNTDELVDCIISNYGISYNQQGGTCKMGPRTDPYAVVDSQLEFYGVRNLRAVDSCIIPSLTIANRNAPLQMIAEKAADMIKAKYGVC